MNRRSSLVVAAALWLTVSALSVPEAAGQKPAGQAQADVTAPGPSQRAVLDRYCVTCHSARAKSGGLVLEKIDLSDVGAHGDMWEKVVRKVRAGMMPPPGMPAPPDVDKQALLTSLTSQLDRAALASPQPGRPLVHRLNRAEYANAIRDLLALEIDPAPLLPVDDSSAGFDNIADVLGLSPVLLESYLSAAGRISALAIGDPKTPPMGEVYRVRQDASQSRHVEGLPLGTVGGFEITRNIPLDGEYAFQVRLFRTNLGTMRGLEFPHQLEISVDGQRVHLAVVWRRPGRPGVERQPDHHGRRDRQPLLRPRAAQGRPAKDYRRLHREDARLQHAAPAVLHPELGGHDRLLRVSAHRSVHHDRSVQSDGCRARRPAAGAIFTCRPATHRRRSGVCAEDSRAACAARLPRRHERRRPAGAARLLHAWTQGGRHVRRRHRHGAAPHPREPEVPAARRARSRRRRTRRGVPPLGSGAGVAAVVLPLEQHSGRRAAQRREQGRAEEAGGAGAAGPPHARGPEGAVRSSRTSPASGCTSATSATSSPIRSSSPTSTTTCAGR